MKLVRFSNPKTKSYGIVQKDKIVCLPTLAKMLKQPVPSTLEEMISQDIKENYIEYLLSNATKTDLTRATIPSNAVKLLAPIARPPKIICLGLNYKDHAEEQGKTPPDEPIIFIKPHTSIIGPDEEIIKPNFVKQLDYEAELAIVVSRKAKNVSTYEASSYIFGYTIFNDISARDIQFKDKQWTRGKSFDTFAPTGPCITTNNQLQDPANLQIRTWVNKKPKQNSTTRYMVFNVFEILYHLSQIMTLEPCDIIATGTPAGVGFAVKPRPQFLQNGDVVEIEIEGIGVLRNRIVDDKPRRDG
ncbi:MAG: fumarylacetoacetate hydrolase family protein [Candidatus Bathyarchaeia archaeon]